MSDWCFDRYFLLEDDVRSLFQWLHEHIGDEWAVDVLGVCLNEDKLILNAVFGTEEHLKLFQKNYIVQLKHGPKLIFLLQVHQQLKFLLLFLLIVLVIQKLIRNLLNLI